MTCSNCSKKTPSLPLEIVEVANGWLVRTSFNRYRDGPTTEHDWHVFNSVDSMTKWLEKRLEQPT